MRYQRNSKDYVSEQRRGGDFHRNLGWWNNFAQAILYRGAGIEIVWRSFAAITAIGHIFFEIAQLHFVVHKIPKHERDRVR